MKLRLNAKLIEDPKAAREVMMSVTAALYTSMDKWTPMAEAAEIAGLCASMWHVCDALSEMAVGAE